MPAGFPAAALRLPEAPEPKAFAYISATCVPLTNLDKLALLIDNLSEIIKLFNLLNQKH